MLKRAHEVIASGDERAIVDYAIEANRTISRATIELESVKAHLRKIALGRSEGALNVELEGNLGVATVAFPRPEAKPRRGKDLKDVEVNLQAEVFARMFSKEILVRPVDGFEDRLPLLAPAERVIIEQFIEIKPSTPKVHLTK